MSFLRQRSSYALFLFVLLCIAYLFIPFHRVCTAVMAVDLMRDLHMDAAMLGTLSSVFFFTYGLMQLPAGLLSDSLGARRILPLFLGITAAGSLLFALADSTPLLLAGRGLVGIGAAVLFIGGLKIFSAWFPVDRFARMNGIFLGMGGVGIIFAAGPLAYACVHIGWRNVILASGVLAVVLAVIAWKWVRDTPEQAGFEPIEAAGEVAACADPKVGAIVRLKGYMKQICSSWNFWCTALWLLGQFTLHMSFGGLWGGPYLMDVHGLTQAEAGNVLNMMGLGMLAGGPLNGWLSDAVFRARRPVMMLDAVIITGLFVVLHQFGADLPVWGLCVWFFLLSVCGVGSVCVGFAAMRDFFGAEATGTASGLLNAFPSMGMILFQPLTGLLLESQGRTETGFTVAGYESICLLYIGFGLAGLLGAFALRDRGISE